MDNFIAAISNTEIIVSLYHPNMFSLYTKFKTVLDTVFVEELDDVTKKLYFHLNEIHKGLTVEGFALHCESLGFSVSVQENLCALFKKYMELEKDDYKALERRAIRFIGHFALQNAVSTYNNNGELEDVIKKVKELEADSLSSDFEDTTLFTDKLFGEINVEEALNTYLAGVIKSSLNIINTSSGVGGYIKGQMVVFSAPAKCGKSMVTMQETVHFLKQNLHVLYAAFGDLKDVDFLYRMASQVNHHPMPYVFSAQFLADEVNLAVQKVPQIATHLRLHQLAPEKFSAEQYVQMIKTKTTAEGQTYYDWADVIIVDYDSNIRSEADSMYAKGENIYQTLYQLVGRDKLVIVLAQTTKISWGAEIIDMSELAESSRKQQIIDVLLTISHPDSFNKQNHVGKINLCATRRGMPMITPYFRDIDGYFHEVSEKTYEEIKASRAPKTFIQDINRYNDYISGNYDVLDPALDHPDFVASAQKNDNYETPSFIEEDNFSFDDDAWRSMNYD